MLLLVLDLRNNEKCETCVYCKLQFHLFDLSFFLSPFVIHHLDENVENFRFPRVAAFSRAR